MFMPQYEVLPFLSAVPVQLTFNHTMWSIFKTMS